MNFSCDLDLLSEGLDPVNIQDLDLLNSCQPFTDEDQIEKDIRTS